MRRLLDVTARLFDRAGDAHLEIRVLVEALVGLVLRVRNAEMGLLEEEERDERTSARGTSGVVRELALLDGTTRREDVGVSWIKHRAGCWGVLLLDAEERGLDVLLVVAEQHVLDLRNQLGSRVGPCGECAAPGPAR